jgi:hypothetical protein
MEKFGQENLGQEDTAESGMGFELPEGRNIMSLLGVEGQFFFGGIVFFWALQAVRW